MSEPKPEDLGRVQDAVRLAGMLPFLRQETERMVKEVENRVFQAITKGELTPDLALNSWLEVNSHRKLLKKIETQIKMGQSAGEKNIYQLEKAS